MKEYLTLFFITFGLIFLPKVYSSDNGNFTRDPNASYDENYPDMNRVLEIPGYKLDPKNALAISIKKEEYEFAKDIDPMISDKARRYVENRKLNFTDDFKLYAAKDLGDYILLYFQEGNTKDGHTVIISDGGFELIYSKELEDIIGTFSAGYKG